MRTLLTLAMAITLSGSACHERVRAGEPMTRDQANRMIEELARNEGGASGGLNEKNLGGLSTPEGDIFFEFNQPFSAAQSPSLKVSALIYRFKEPPKPGVIEGFQAEEEAGTPTGGGTVEFEPENKGLYLARTYTQTADGERFQQDVRALIAASKVWGSDVLERVTQRVFHGQ